MVPTMEPANPQPSFITLADHVSDESCRLVADDLTNEAQNDFSISIRIGVIFPARHMASVQRTLGSYMVDGMKTQTWFQPGDMLAM